MFTSPFTDSVRKIADALLSECYVFYFNVTVRFAAPLQQQVNPAAFRAVAYFLPYCVVSLQFFYCSILYSLSDQFIRQACIYADKDSRSHLNQFPTQGIFALRIV